MKTLPLLSGLAALALACSNSPATPAAVDAGADAGTAADTLIDALADVPPEADAPAADQTATVADALADVPPAADASATDGSTSDGTATDSIGDDSTASDGASTDADAAPMTTPGGLPLPCKPGAQACEGIQQATCNGKGTDWLVSPCSPGSACLGDKCKPVGANFVIIFDTSGSMNADVNKCAPTFNDWPTCEDPAKFPEGCTRTGVSKAVFLKALAQLDDQVTHMALFRFPQTGGTCTSSFCSCSDGGYNGSDKITGDIGQQTVTPLSSWYWNNLKQIMCVNFPEQKGEQTKKAIVEWMDNVQTATNPELRATGGTPIGKSLFYAGEYIRNRVVVDGLPCDADADCKNANYVCDKGKCKDPLRSCRDTVVILFTDGGESADNNYDSPWAQAKRMSIGLGCDTDADCVGNATCQSVQQCAGNSASELANGTPCVVDADCPAKTTCKTFQQCMPKVEDVVTGHFCSKGATPCLPGVPAKLDDGKDNPAWCAGECTPDPRKRVTVKAKLPEHNVLRSPDGKPFGVKLFVVDIGSTSADDVKQSMALAIAGNGKLLGASASDPAAFLGALTAAFDLKTKAVCGIEK